MTGLHDVDEYIQAQLVLAVSKFSIFKPGEIRDLGCCCYLLAVPTESHFNFTYRLILARV